MIARTLCFGSRGKLSVKDEQLVWDGDDSAHHTFPLEDVGFVILESKLIAISANALQHMAAHNVALVVCDETHTPSAQLLPFSAHSTTQETVASQFAATEAVNGRLWRQLVRQKLLNQSALLKRLGKSESTRLVSLADEVKNYDSANCEAQGARIYFQALAPSSDFTRDPDGVWPNAALNYGYAIIRAAVARALVGSGLLCIRGIHHHNRYNAFCLADDVMEPFRPFVDQYVLGRIPPFDISASELSHEMKARLLQALTCDVTMENVKRPLMIAVTITSASLAKYYLGKTDSLSLPILK